MKSAIQFKNLTDKTDFFVMPLILVIGFVIRILGINVGLPDST